MNKTNYYEQFLSTYRRINCLDSGTKPKLLFHVCCGPCSAYPLVFLQDLFDITILYTNSNIYPYEEYQRRLKCLTNYVDMINSIFKKNIEVIVEDYNYDEFRKILLPYKDQKENSTRCHICIQKRLTNLFEYAVKNNFPNVATVMTVSRNKDEQFMNTLGLNMMKKYKNITYIPTDFKKNNGANIGVKISHKYNMYRQNYCGCEFSLNSKDINK
ncbi:MAG: epoxyqueuosine reductase QueH [Bacillales bacterium]